MKFTSDWVHYAWPYVRMDPAWSGTQGGVIDDDQGRRGQAATNEQYAEWIDYSNTVDGETDGVAVLLPPSDEPRKWLTREYGTFGPRRGRRAQRHGLRARAGATRSTAGPRSSSTVATRRAVAWPSDTRDGSRGSAMPIERREFLGLLAISAAAGRLAGARASRGAADRCVKIDRIEVFPPAIR